MGGEQVLEQFGSKAGQSCRLYRSLECVHPLLHCRCQFLRHSSAKLGCVAHSSSHSFVLRKQAKTRRKGKEGINIFEFSFEKMSNGFEEADEIPRLLQYLRIRSVQPTPDYASCVSFLVKLANGLRLTHQVHYFNNKPLLVMTRQGAEPALPSLLLTSHMDVVPVTTVPFSQTWSAMRR